MRRNVLSDALRSMGCWSAAAALSLSGACGEAEESWECALPPDSQAEFSAQVGCRDDFDTLASQPTDSSIPGAVSLKTVVDRSDDNRLYFQNTNQFGIHWEFVSANASGGDLPLVPTLESFNRTEYYSPDRRFLLGSVTYYEGPDAWVYEISPYDTASAELIEVAYAAIAASAYFGKDLRFHPTSEAVERAARDLPDSVRQIGTDELYAGTDYQALNLGTSYGHLRRMSATELETEYVGFRDIVVLDKIPNDISVVSGIITAEFQTPLSHINVLSQNRGTPNMGLRGAHDSEALKALDGEWVRLEVGAFEYTVKKVSVEEADAWWEKHKPDAVAVPNFDLDATALQDVETMLDQEMPLRDAIKQAVGAYGGKASHYAALSQIETVPSPKAFAIPVFYYQQFLEQNGFDQRIEEMLLDASFQSDPEVRDGMLDDLRADMLVAPVDAEFEAALLQKLADDHPGIRMRFRSSTNAEDLDGFTGAGLYTSKSGDPNDPDQPVLDAVREVWSSVWYFRAFEERSYRSIDHTAVGMALLVHQSFPDEEANGVALTANPFDTSGAEPGFYVNVQLGEDSVVQPPAGVTTDQYVHHFDLPGQPVVFIEHSSLVGPGRTVLTAQQTRELGQALSDVHAYFYKAYGAGSNKWYAMDVEFKFDGEPGQEPRLYVKQARPHPGRGN